MGSDDDHIGSELLGPARDHVGSSSLVQMDRCLTLEGLADLRELLRRSGSCRDEVLRSQRNSVGSDRIREIDGVHDLDGGSSLFRQFPTEAGRRLRLLGEIRRENDVANGLALHLLHSLDRDDRDVEGA